MSTATSSRPPAEPVRLVHVGLGDWGTNWERHAIPPVPEVDRVALVDPHEPTLRAAQETFGVPDAACFTSLDAALGAVRADAVLLTTPMTTHVPFALEALAAGAHVLVEKPFAGTVAEAREAVEAAERQGLTLQVSQNYRTYPAPQEARRLVRAGAVGELSAVAVDFRRWDHDAPAGASRHYDFPHPLLFDMAIHHVDLLRMITGRDAVEVYAKVMDPPWSRYREEASAALTVEMAGGLVVSYRGSWVSRAPQTAWAGRWSLEGSDGHLAFTSRGGEGPDDDELELTTATGPGARTPQRVELARPSLWGRSAGLRAFAAAVRGGPAPETTGRDNLGSVALMEAAARSAASGRVEAVEQVQRVERVERVEEERA